MEELEDVETASIISRGFMMAQTNRFDTARFMTNLKTETMCFMSHNNIVIRQILFLYGS